MKPTGPRSAAGAKNAAGAQGGGRHLRPHAVLRAIGGLRLADIRDRALLAFMASALRRSELVALMVADLERVPNGFRVRAVRSKAGQEAGGIVVAVPDGRRLNPAAHLDAWLARAGIGAGPVFRSLVNGRVGAARAVPHPSWATCCMPSPAFRIRRSKPLPRQPRRPSHDRLRSVRTFAQRFRAALDGFHGPIGSYAASATARFPLQPSGAA